MIRSASFAFFVSFGVIMISQLFLRQLLVERLQVGIIGQFCLMHGIHRKDGLVGLFNPALFAQVEYLFDGHGDTDLIDKHAVKLIPEGGDGGADWTLVG